MSDPSSLSGISVIVPAAGEGTRMMSRVRKQFVEIEGQTILWHTVTRLLSLEPDRMVVALPSNAAISLPAGVKTVCGGETRQESVMSALAEFDELDDSSWIMVHDGVRPCVRPSDIFALYRGVADHEVGGILGVPLVDTIKQVDVIQESAVIEGTLNRQGLWAALTPQLFRKGVLKQALNSAFDMTDEASAVEALGYRPIIVEGSRDNIKVTRPEDLVLAGFYLSQQELTC